MADPRHTTVFDREKLFSSSVEISGIIGGPAPRGASTPKILNLLKNCRFWAFLEHFWRKNTHFDNNWSNIITLDHFSAKISDFLALSKIVRKSKFLRVIFLVKLWPKNAIKRKNAGL